MLKYVFKGYATGVVQEILALATNQPADIDAYLKKQDKFTLNLISQHTRRILKSKNSELTQNIQSNQLGLTKIFKSIPSFHNLNKRNQIKFIADIVKLGGGHVFRDIIKQA